MERANSLAIDKGKNTIVYLQPSGYASQTINVYSIEAGEMQEGISYSVDAGKVVKEGNPLTN